MLLFELYKVLNSDIESLIYDRAGDIIYYGSLSNLDVDFLQSRVIFLTPLNKYEILIKLDV